MPADATNPSTSIVREPRIYLVGRQSVVDQALINGIEIL